MERLTNKCEADAQREGCERRLANGYQRSIPVERFLRLAAYEDTGLTPELVQETAELAVWVHENGLEKIKEWIKADKEGRLVVLSSIKALTNADCMRTATNQQLAKQIYDSQKELCRMVYKNLGFEDELNFSEDYSDILAWLNAPSKEAKKALEAKRDG